MVFWLLLLAGVVYALAFVSERHDETVCSGLDLEITDGSTYPLITADDIREIIIAETDTLEGRKLNEIDMHRINDILKDIPYISHASINSGIRGHITVRVSLRDAIIRVTNKYGTAFYIDMDGMIMPINSGHPARVIIANGNIGDKIDFSQHKNFHIDSLPARSITRKLYRMALYINGSSFLSKLLTQIWVNKNAELEITPMVGNYLIHFGGFDDMEEKFEKLETYYMQGAGKAGWIDYKSIDLRYKNQVICSKK